MDIGFLQGLPKRLSDLLSYMTTNLSTTRAAAIDRLDATISSRAAASSALSNGTWTDSLAASLSGAARIKQIIHGTVTASVGGGGNSGSGGTAIAAVVKAKSVLIHTGIVFTDAVGTRELLMGDGRLELSPTAVTGYIAVQNAVYQYGSITAVIGFVVVEFY